jgi:hypothetical protein
MEFVKNIGSAMGFNSYDADAEVGKIVENLQKCKSTMTDATNALNDEDYEIIDKIMKSLPHIVKEFKKHSRTLSQNAANMDAENATKLMETAKEFLERPETVELVDRIVDKYGPILEDENNMHAIGSYIKCVLSNIDEKYKRAAVAATEMSLALFSLVGKGTKVRSFASNVGKNLKSNVLGPINKELNSVNSKNAKNAKPNNNSGAKQLTNSATPSAGGGQGRGAATRQKRGGSAPVPSSSSASKLRSRSNSNKQSRGSPKNTTQKSVSRGGCGSSRPRQSSSKRT